MSGPSGLRWCGVARKRMASTMANLNHPVREHPSESRATRLRAPLAEKTEGRAGQVGTIKSRDGRILEVRRYCKPRLRPWAEGAPGADPHGSPPRSALHSLSASTVVRLPMSPASGRLLPPGPPENLAWTEGVPRPSDTAHYGCPLRAPGRTETPELAIQTIQSTKLGGRQPPDRLRRTHPVPAPLHESTISPSATGTCRTSGGYS
ncbi:MAG: hypothetical protein ACI8RZ_007217 [Myxococcota bacterium]|jgi:hypothetical protein